MAMAAPARQYAPLDVFPVCTHHAKQRDQNQDQGMSVGEVCPGPEYEFGLLRVASGQPDPGYLTSAEVHRRDALLACMPGSAEPDADGLPVVDVCVVHYPCMDGIAAAAVVHDIHPAVPILHTDHARIRLITNELRGKTVLFVDIAPMPEMAGQWGMKQFFILDHHPETADLARLYGPDRMLCRSKESGASLAWWFVHGHARFPTSVLATRANDTYDYSTCPDARVYYAGMRALGGGRSVECLLCHVESLYNLDAVVTPEALTAEHARAKACAKLALTAQRMYHGTTPVYVVSGERYELINDAAREILTRTDGLSAHDIHERRNGVALFRALVTSDQGQSTKWSTRCLSGDAARRLAKLFGGNGHDQAAGFSTPGHDIPAAFVSEPEH